MIVVDLISHLRVRPIQRCIEADRSPAPRRQVVALTSLAMPLASDTVPTPDRNDNGTRVCCVTSNFR
ncbi:MAG: hypothetical protein GY750_16595 [Lentisphaerae bacterium]|nr:hypothetical protein [Lentisphaerota bacterium]